MPKAKRPRCGHTWKGKKVEIISDINNNENNDTLYKYIYFFVNFIRVSLNSYVSFESKKTIKSINDFK